MAASVHGLPVTEFAGRVYAHIPSPVKKKSLDDSSLLTVHRAQWEPFKSRKRFRVVVAGRRWGKTHWTCVELLLAARAAPKQRVWYVAPTYSMARQIAWEKLKEIIPLSWIAKTSRGLAINESRLTIMLTNGSQISLKGADRPDSTRGVGVHFLVLDEFQDMKQELWTAIRPTLSDTRGRCIFIGTPKSYNHLHEMYMRGQPNPKTGKVHPQWDSWQFKTGDSPFIPPSELEHARNDMDPRTYRQEYEASFETMAGRVYYDFDRRLNVRRCPYDPSLPVWVGQDFNVDPMSTELIQIHGREVWVTGEMALRSSSTEDVCRELLDEYGWGLLDRATIYPDPAGQYRSSARGESDVQIFREWGFNRILFHRKHPSVRDRIAAVNRLICDAKGERRLFIDPSCTELIKCLEQLIYKTGTNEPDKSLGIEHAGDAIGYPLEYEFPIRKPFVAKGYSH